MTLEWNKEKGSRVAKLFFKKGTEFKPGQQFRVRGRIRLIMQPERTSGFAPRQLLITYCITLTIKD